MGQYVGLVYTSALMCICIFSVATDAFHAYLCWCYWCCQQASRQMVISIWLCTRNHCETLKDFQVMFF